MLLGRFLFPVLFIYRSNQMKSLKPSMREHKRYLLLKGKNLKDNVENAILEFIGVLGMSQCGLSWIKSNIISVNRELIDKVRASFAVSPDRIEVVKVSGTLKGLGANTTRKPYKS